MTKFKFFTFWHGRRFLEVDLCVRDRGSHTQSCLGVCECSGVVWDRIRCGVGVSCGGVADFHIRKVIWWGPRWGPCGVHVGSTWGPRGVHMGLSKGGSGPERWFGVV